MKRDRNYGRWRSVLRSRTEITEVIKHQLFVNNIQADNAEIADFSNWVIKHLWHKYKEDYMELQNIAMKRMDNTPIVIPNATKGKSYVSPTVTLPEDSDADYELIGLDGTGLEIVRLVDENKFNIQGTPIVTGDVSFKIRYKFNGWVKGQPVLEREICFAINPDPREIMEQSQKPTPKDIAFYKEDKDCQYIKVETGEDGIPRKDIVAASNRGRSHGRDAKPRDDHFSLYHSCENDWYVIAVADGAGSAKYSRKGSELACRTVVEYCKEKLSDADDFESKIISYHTAEDEVSARKAVGDYVYAIVGNAAFRAHKAITELAKHEVDTKAKDFATTLLLAICKKFDFGWFVASFWVGDGAMCVYDKNKHTVKLLGVPDEGEYSGQTRFLTMPEIFADSVSIYNRLRFGIYDDFTALILMTDGVSDPMFGTDANLNNIDKWDEFWETLSNGFPEDNITGVDLSDDNELAKDQLLKWLDFWKRGEHDDRTIAILY